MFGEVLTDRFLRLSYVDGEHHQALAGELLMDVVHQLLFAAAVGAPGGPELQQDNLPLDGLVGEGLAGERLGPEARRGLTVVIAGKSPEGREDYGAAQHSPEDAATAWHARGIYHRHGLETHPRGQ